MIQAVSHVQLGVSLWQRCFSLQLAARWSYAHSAMVLPGFPAIPTDRKNRHVLGPRLRLEGQWPREASTGRNLTEAELRMPPEACVVLAGEFQRFDLISEARERVREDWLRLKAPLPVRPPGELLLVVREGEQAMTEPDIRKLAAMAPGRLHFLTDQSNDPLRLVLRELGGTWHVEDGLDALRLVHSFQRVAFCQSALAWWGAFLGAGREIYFPNIDSGHWSHPAPAKFAWEPEHYGIDLRVPDEERWIYEW